MESGRHLQTKCAKMLIMGDRPELKDLFKGWVARRVYLMSFSKVGLISNYSWFPTLYYWEYGSHCLQTTKHRQSACPLLKEATELPAFFSMLWTPKTLTDRPQPEPSCTDKVSIITWTLNSHAAQTVEECWFDEGGLLWRFLSCSLLSWSHCAD